jgi:hypothetical protein
MAYCPGRRVNPVSYCIGPVASWCASSSVRVISSRSRTFCNVAPWSSFTSPMTSTVVLATPRRRARVSSCPGILRPLLDQHFIHRDGAIEPRVPRITDVAELGICCVALSTSTTSAALTCRWTRMLPSIGLPNRQPVARSSQSHTSAVCITTTNVARLERRSRRTHLSDRLARSSAVVRHAGPPSCTRVASLVVGFVKSVSPPLLTHTLTVASPHRTSSRPWRRSFR